MSTLSRGGCKLLLAATITCYRNLPSWVTTVMYTNGPIPTYFVQVWDSTSGRELLSFTGHDQEVFTCMFSPDDINVVSCSADKTVKVLSQVNVEAWSSETKWVDSGKSANFCSLMAAIRLISIMLHNNKWVNDIKTVFMKKSDMDLSILQNCICAIQIIVVVYLFRTLMMTKMLL